MTEPVQPNFGRRASDREESGHNVPALRVEIRNMAENISHMRASIDNMAREFNRLSVLEERHESQSQAMERAFSEIVAVSKKLETYEANVGKKNEYYDRWVNRLIGASMAIVVVWTVFGVWVSNTVKEVALAVEQMKFHIATDKVLSPDDVRNSVPRMKE